MKRTESMELAMIIASRPSITAAKDILAAGYRKVTKVTAVEELDALPDGAVIKDDDLDVLVAVRCTGSPEDGVPDYNCWDQVAETWPLDSDKVKLPATVLDANAVAS